MLTLEERERIAYITNSPEHATIVLAIDAENEEQAIHDSGVDLVV